MITIEYYLLIGSILILLSVALAKFTDNLGVPTLLLFLGLGMIVGTDGIGWIDFDNAFVAQSIGTGALIFILFSGGLGTKWNETKPILKYALSLSTIGVLITAIITGFAVYYIFNIPLLFALLLGSIISSTDAAAVFSVLNSKNISLKGKLKPLLEVESGSNDPMAIFLTIGLIELYLNPGKSYLSLIWLFIMQMGLGTIMGLSLGKLMIILINYIKVPYQGVYSVFAIAFIAFIFSSTALLGGSGFLAVYLAGIVIGNHKYVQKKTMGRFFDGMAWLSQIGMFLTLGLLVFPSTLIYISLSGFSIALILMFVARPISVFISLAFIKGLDLREKIFVSWVGLRGAVPVILATYPLVAGLPDSSLFFNLVFFIVLTSALLQGWTLAPVSKLLKVDAPLIKSKSSPIEIAPVEGVNAELTDFYVSYNSKLIGKTIVDLKLPSDSLIVLITRNENYVVPSGGTVIEEGDILLVLVTKQNIWKVQKIFS
ncbi:MAG TPA: potassium/proton antiporter [Ignavibacteriaceae bacterium]|nr:potassium/proton antiporter [Ignavibacteriaceae bacterium]